MKIFVFIVFFILFSACSSMDTIRVGGGYTTPDGTKIEGDIEIGMNKSETEYVGLPMLESKAGEKFMLLDRKQADLLASKIEPDKKSILSISPFKKISEFLKK